MKIIATAPRGCFSVRECEVYYSKQETEPLKTVQRKLRER